MDRNTIVSLLTEQVIEVEFEKKNGDIRVMLATLMKDYLPETTGSSATNEDTVTVWDVEENSWRSFRLDSLISVEYDQDDQVVIWQVED